jgi:hypothetical protein
MLSERKIQLLIGLVALVAAVGGAAILLPQFGQAIGAVAVIVLGVLVLWGYLTG